MRRELGEMRDEAGRVVVQDGVAFVVRDPRVVQRLVGPVAAEPGAVGAIDDLARAVGGDARLDGARAERVAVDEQVGLGEPGGRSGSSGVSRMLRWSSRSTSKAMLPPRLWSMILASG